MTLKIEERIKDLINVHPYHYTERKRRLEEAIEEYAKEQFMKGYILAKEEGNNESI